MAKFLPFVNEKSPEHVVFNKLKTKYSSLPNVDFVQLFNILMSVGIDAVEEYLSKSKAITDQAIVREIIRNFNVVPTPHERVEVLRYFIKWAESEKTTLFSEDFLSIPVDGRHQFLAATPVYVADKYLSWQANIFYCNAYLTDFKEYKIFSSSDLANTIVFDSEKELKAFILYRVLTKNAGDPIKAVLKRESL